MLKEKPKTVFVQNPSIVLCVFAAIVQQIRKAPLIVDAHNMGIAFEHRFRGVVFIGQLLNNLIIKHACLTIVTTRSFASIVERQKGKAFVLPDPFPVFDTYQKISFKGKYNILYVCTFALDEPYCEMIEAAGLMKDVCVHITGRYKTENLPAYVPENVIFTGFLPDDQYINYLHSVDAVVDLTHRENCLVCGAYEAVSARRPLILSKKQCLMEYFSDAAVYTDNTPADIAACVYAALQNADKMIKQIDAVKQKREDDWHKKQKQLMQLINEKT